MPHLDGLYRTAQPATTSMAVVPLRRYEPRRISLAILILLIGLAISATAVAGDIKTVATLRSALPPGHYLVLFQNNAELRPSGGFLGSFATVDLTQTGYENLRIDTNIYKRDNAFTERHHISVPTPLEGVAANNSWAMRDSNWDLDFRDAAFRVSWFYQQEGGEPVDGVIALNATVLQDVLRLTGPIALPDGSGNLQADTFFETLAYKIEKQYFYDPEGRSQNEPKTILKELIPNLIQAIRRPAVIAQAVPLLEQELRERHIQLFHTDPIVEQRIVDNGWGGSLHEPADDFLLINNASVGGMKSSLHVAQTTDLALTRSGSSVDHTLTIERTHTGDGIWPDHTNNNYSRIVVPAGAILDSVIRNGHDVTNEVDLSTDRNKTVYGIHFDTSPGEKSRLVVHYRLTATTDTFYYQKQSGIVSEQLRLSVAGQSLFDRLITSDVEVDI